MLPPVVVICFNYIALVTFDNNINETKEIKQHMPPCFAAWWKVLQKLKRTGTSFEKKKKYKKNVLDWI